MYSRLKPLGLTKSVVANFLIPAIYQSDHFQKKIRQEKITLMEIEKRLFPYQTVSDDLKTDLEVVSKKLPHPLFAKYRRIVVEFCCGTGEFLWHAAQSDRQSLFIGVDYSYPCLERAIKKAFTQQIQSEQMQSANILFYHGRADDFLWDFQNFKFAEIMINFPDPWPKKRHYKRRVLNNRFLTLLQGNALRDTNICFTADDTKPEKTKLMTATDVPQLYEYHLQILKQANFLKNKQSEHPQEIPAPYYDYSSRYAKKKLSKVKNIFYTCHQFI